MAAHKINFTQQRIESLISPEKGRVDYDDTGCPKLTCRVSPTGNKSFVVLKKNTAGKTQRITLGRFPDITVSQAQKLTIETLSNLAIGIDPIEEKRKKKYLAITLNELLNIYLKDKSDLRTQNLKNY